MWPHSGTSCIITFRTKDPLFFFISLQLQILTKIFRQKKKDNSFIVAHIWNISGILWGRCRPEKHIRK